MGKKHKKVVPKLRITTLRAYGNEAEQSWYFLGYDEENYGLYNMRWIIVRKYQRNGGVWWGVRANFQDTHENGIALIDEEMKLAKEAIKTLKKNWRKLLDS